MRRRGFLAAALAAGIAPAVCKADSLMRIVVPNFPEGRWRVSAGGILLEEGRLIVSEWTAVEVSLVSIPVDRSCYIRHDFDRPAAVPAGGVVALEFKLGYVDQEGLRRLASQRM